MKRLDNRMVE